ncbi:hypothetical protein K488DRAFT_43016 [Vararia minispora EC-137]|uniref:Uncharacterized protein n=1 Tax=Vararia minispora EC-137 TaxID=1314806 RepID=A0ACB8QV82_9AGAM|nr:hypothetical protein K488DRAFT_43016 [Vararia minispora EC-137]
MPPRAQPGGKSITPTAQKPLNAFKKRTGPLKKELTAAERSKKLYATLCKQIDGGHFANAVKTCDKLLALDAQDGDALQTKLFLLLQTDQYILALTMLDSREGFDGKFERAYSLYRLQRETEAERVLGGLKAAGQGDRGIQHFEAQLSYRQGDYQTAFDIYNQLLDTSELQSEEHSDISTNLQAAQKHLDFINTDYLRSLGALDNSLTSTLELVPPPSQPGVPAAVVPVASTPAALREETKKPVRMRRVPKGVVPGVTPPPDPERWLKKTERSTYQAPRGKKKGGGATQGIIENASNIPVSQSKGGKGKKKK